MKIPKPLQNISGISGTVVFGEIFSRGDKPYLSIKPASRQGNHVSRPPKFSQVTQNLIEVEMCYDIEVKHVSQWNPVVFNDFIIRCQGKNELRREYSFWQRTAKTTFGLKAYSRFNSNRCTEFYVRFYFLKEDLQRENLPVRIQPVISFEYYSNRKSDFIRISMELPEAVICEVPTIHLRK